MKAKRRVLRAGAAWLVVVSVGLGPACATTFKCGDHFECNIATEYCQTTTGGAVSERGAPSPVSHCVRFAENDFLPV